jgi:acylphosphatase
VSERSVVHVRIEGRVQGVWYRGWTVEEATRRGLDGWVRNRRDGSVEAVFAGSPGEVAAMIAACHQGPPSARVTRVTSEPSSETPSLGFIQQPTL